MELLARIDLDAVTLAGNDALPDAVLVAVTDLLTLPVGENDCDPARGMHINIIDNRRFKNIYHLITIWDSDYQKIRDG